MSLLQILPAPVFGCVNAIGGEQAHSFIVHSCLVRNRTIRVAIPAIFVQMRTDESCTVEYAHANYLYADDGLVGRVRVYAGCVHMILLLCELRCLRHRDALTSTNDRPKPSNIIPTMYIRTETQFAAWWQNVLAIYGGTVSLTIVCYAIILCGVCFRRCTRPHIAHSYA